ncbi:MAG: hypothetical protein JJT81_00155 [Rubellimicrobium sp.]|nr:hypothetical protein [Rubellimicrobium sp.]
MRTIDIDFDIHRLIQLERRSFDEPEYVALRRLLKLGPPPEDETPQKDKSMRPWSKGGITLPHGTELRMEYNGILHLGRIADGMWEVEGHREKSASGAASAVARTRDGGKVNINGKAYWQVRRPGDTDWTPYADLKRKR